MWFLRAVCRDGVYIHIYTELEGRYIWDASQFSTCAAAARLIETERYSCRVLCDFVREMLLVGCGKHALVFFPESHRFR